jgi:transposase
MAAYRSCASPLEAIRRAAKEEFACLAHSSPKAELLMTTRYIGHPTAAVGILSAIGDTERFGEPHKLVSCFGLNPIVHRSADRCYIRGASKQGPCQARCL